MKNGKTTKSDVQTLSTNPARYTRFAQQTLFCVDLGVSSMSRLRLRARREISATDTEASAAADMSSMGIIFSFASIINFLPFSAFVPWKISSEHITQLFCSNVVFLNLNLATYRIHDK